MEGGETSMAFDQGEADNLLAQTGRRCCICKRLHGVQLHHITPREEGGSDDIENAIPLCPNCHDEVHIGYASGRVTRRYTSGELKQHRQMTIQQAQNAAQWQPDSPVAQQDQELILFYAQCLDRPAFRTHFSNEDSFSDFDCAMEDTLSAINTGYARLKDGTAIERAKGKVYLVRADWREKMDQITAIIEDIRSHFQRALGLDEMLMNYHRRSRHDPSFDWRMEQAIGEHFRANASLDEYINERRRKAIALMNAVLAEIGHPPLSGA